MRFPGYLLNPGDMFQVDPERVMFATGAPKTKSERREARLERRNANEAKSAEGEAAEEGKENEANAETKAEEAEEEAQEDTRETLKKLMAQAKSLMSKDKSDLPAKRKQELRGFQKAIRRVLSRSESSSILTGNLETQFAELLSLLKAKRSDKAPQGQSQSQSQNQNQNKPTSRQAGESSEAADPELEDVQPGQKLTQAFQKAAENPTENVDTSELLDDEIDTLKRALVQMRDNPIDSSKPYATPWRPRDFMSAFAFVPRYLEVNQNICAAVYLRHPVARPGYSEVPSPFSEGINTAAFTWYLRRR